MTAFFEYNNEISGSKKWWVIFFLPERDYLFLKDPCPNRWLVCYLLCSLLTLERREWEEDIKMNRAEI
jgi:hypothetical protein